jgi:hypothetical protein
MAGHRSRRALRRTLLRSSLPNRSHQHDLSRAYELALPILRQALAPTPSPPSVDQPTCCPRVPKTLCGA